MNRLTNDQDNYAHLVIFLRDILLKSIFSRKVSFPNVITIKGFWLIDRISSPYSLVSICIV